MSLIIPTRCRPQLLVRAVESAKLAGRDVEVVVVDDASTDSTAEVCRALEGIKYVRLEHNLGVAGARNAGLLESSAEYIAFLDDDDLRLAASLDLQVAALARQPKAGFVCGSMLLADQEGRLTGEKSAPNHPGGDIFWELLELAFPVMPLSVLFRKECFFRVGLFGNRLAGIDDWDIFVRIAELYPVLVMDEAVGIYRQPTPCSGQGSSRLARHLTRAVSHQRELLRLPRAMSASAERRRQARSAAINRVANTLLRRAAEGLPTGSYGFVCANILSALRLDPLYVARPGVYKRLFTRFLAP
ncbi:MAG TPA: glycosyltransferase family 2 protein [Pyrinomonadaceae bacterium]|nr:glycosyltransferase family 2 protein [Pyrinomonadaceae bacterium]